MLTESVMRRRLTVPERRQRQRSKLRSIIAAYTRANKDWRQLGMFKRAEEPTPENIEKIIRAWKFARKIHEGETRDSGEDYLRHCERVALKIAKKGGSSDSICVALEHDTIEAKDEHGVNKSSFFQLSRLFGSKIARRVALLTKPKWSGREWIDATHPSYRKMKDKYGKMHKWDGGKWVAPGCNGYDELQDAPVMSAEKDRVYYARLFSSGDLRALAVKFEDTADNLETLDFVTGQKRERKLVATARYLLWVAWRLDSEVFEEQKQILLMQGLPKRKLHELLEEIKPKPVATPVVVMPPRIILDQRYLEGLPEAGATNIAMIYTHPNHLFCRDRIEVEVRLGRDVLEQLKAAFPRLVIKRGRSLLMPGQTGGGSFEFYVINGFRPKIAAKYVKTTGRGMQRRFTIAHDGKTTRSTALNLHNIRVENIVPKRHWRSTLREYERFQQQFTEWFIAARDAANGNGKAC